MSKITFRLGTDNADFKKGLASAETDAKQSSGRIASSFERVKGASLGIAAAFGAAALVLKKGFGDAIAEADRFATLSENLGASTDALQAFDYAARQNSGDFEQLAKALGAVSVRSQELIDGEALMVKAFGRLGLSARDFIGLNTEERLALVAKGFAEATDKGAALTAIADILGMKAGPKLAATLKEIGEQGLPGLIQGAKDAGQVIDRHVIVALDKFADKMSAIGKRTKVFFADMAFSIIGLARHIANPAKAGDDMIAEEIADRLKTDEGKKAAADAERARAKAAQDAKKAKEAEKRDAKDKPKLDAYIRAKQANDKEAAQQALDSLSNEGRLAALTKERLQLEKQMAALPRNQIDAETKREAIRARILAITKDQKTTEEKIADAQEKAAKDAEQHAEKLKDATEKVAEAVKKVGDAARDANNAKYDPFRFSLGDAASGARGSGRAKGNAGLIQSKEDQARAILDRNNLQFDEQGRIQYVPGEGESPEAIRDKQKIAETQTLPRLQKLMGGAANLRKATANLDRADQDPTAQAKKAYMDALDESKRLTEIRDSLAGKFKVQP